MTRYVKCEACGYESEAHKPHDVVTTRVEFGDGTPDLSGELCGRCRNSVREVFPRPDELTLPEWMNKVPVDEVEWDRVDRSGMSL